MDKYTIYMKKFQIALGIFALSLIVFIFLVSKVIPEVQKISQIQNDYKTQSSALADSERKLQDLKDAARRKEAENENIQKIFFKPISEGLDICYQHFLRNYHPEDHSHILQISF